MQRTQIYLTKAQQAGLKQLAINKGKNKSELIRRAIDNLLNESTEQEANWKMALKKVKGVWANNSAIAQDIQQIRDEFDRYDPDQ